MTTRTPVPNFARAFWDHAYADDSDLDHWTSAEPIVGRDDLAGLPSATDSGWLVDLGCGRGVESKHLARCGFSVLALDLSVAALARIRDPGPTAVAGDAFQLPLPDASIGAVIDCGLLHTLAPESRGRYRRELARIVQPRGCLLVIGATVDDEESGLFSVDAAALETVLAIDFRLMSQRPAILEALDHELEATSTSWQRR